MKSWVLKRLDIWVFCSLVGGNAVFVGLYNLLILKTTFPVNIGTVYEKVGICLTCTSILLAASGFLLSMTATREVWTAAVKEKLMRALGWLSLALLSGIINVAVMPSRMSLGAFLEYQQAAMWLWLYLTGPTMYSGVIVGTIWFALAVRSLSVNRASDSRTL